MERFSHCPLCGTELDAAHATECPHCDWVLGYRRTRAQVEGGHHASRDVIAAALSLVPGAGHLYKGHLRLGATIFGVMFLLGLFVLATVTSTVGASLLALPFFWGAAMMHAYLAEDLRATPAAQAKWNADHAEPHHPGGGGLMAH